MNKNNNGCKEFYGISRVDCEKHGAHAWKFSLRRHGKRHSRNFADKKYGDKARALVKAKEFRDQFLFEHPPISRKEFCNVKRRHNKTGITGVCKFSKAINLKMERFESHGTGRQIGPTPMVKVLTNLSLFEYLATIWQSKKQFALVRTE